MMHPGDYIGFHDSAGPDSALALAVEPWPFDFIVIHKLRPLAAKSGPAT